MTCILLSNIRKKTDLPEQYVDDINWSFSGGKTSANTLKSHTFINQNLPLDNVTTISPWTSHDLEEPVRELGTCEEISDEFPSSSSS
jgi:hypothetical protein